MDQVFDIRDVVNNYFVYLRLSPLLFPSGGNAVKTICIPFGCRRSHACACAMATLPDTACNVHPVIFWEGISPAIAVLNKQKHARTHRIAYCRSLQHHRHHHQYLFIDLIQSLSSIHYMTLDTTNGWRTEMMQMDGQTVVVRESASTREWEWEKKLWLKLRVKLSSGGISRRRLSSPLTRTPHTHMLFHILYPSFRLRKRTRVFHFGMQFISFPLFLFLYWISLHTYNFPPPSPLSLPFPVPVPPNPPFPPPLLLFLHLLPCPVIRYYSFRKSPAKSCPTRPTTTVLSKRNCFFVLPVLWGPKWWW